jgi:hypothetical protein
VSTQETPAAPAETQDAEARAVREFVRLFEHAERPVQAIRDFVAVLFGVARDEARDVAHLRADILADAVVQRASAAVLAEQGARVRSIAVDPGFDGVPSALFALTEDGDLWQRMVHLGPPAWERVPLPPGSAAPPTAHERHLREFRRLVAQQLDPKLVQDLYDMAEEGSAHDTTTTTQEPIG